MSTTTTANIFSVCMSNKAQPEKMRCPLLSSKDPDSVNTLSYVEVHPPSGYDDYDDSVDDEDVIVDLDSGSDVPVNLNTWLMLNKITSSFEKL